MNPGGGPGGYTFRLREGFEEFPSDHYEVSFQEVQTQSPATHEAPEWRLAAKIAAYPLWQKPGLRRLRFAVSRLAPKIPGYPYPISGIEGFNMMAGVMAGQGQELSRLLGKSLWQNDLVVVHSTVWAGHLLEQRSGHGVIAVMSHSGTPVYVELAALYEPDMPLEECLRDETIAPYLQQELNIYERVDFIIVPALSAVDGYCTIGPQWQKVFTSSKVVTSVLPGLQSLKWLEHRRSGGNN